MQNISFEHKPKVWNFACHLLSGTEIIYNRQLLVKFVLVLNYIKLLIILNKFRIITHIK